jgi:hypothetical protein
MCPCSCREERAGREWEPLRRGRRGTIDLDIVMSLVVDIAVTQCLKLRIRTSSCPTPPELGVLFGRPRPSARDLIFMHLAEKAVVC